MIYPTELLPQRHFKIIDFANDDCKFEKLVLCRITKDSDFTELDSDDSAVIKYDYISIELDHLRDFSTNLLGVFNQNHFKIEWIKPKAKDDKMFEIWDKKNENICPVFQIHFVIKLKQSAFFLKLSDFQNKNIPNDQNDEIISKVIHTPCNSNYWHFSIKWLINGIDSSELPKSKRRSVLSIARTQISLLGLKVTPEFNLIESKCYHL